MTTFTAIDGSTVTPKTRADLMQHPAFAALNVDIEGNPCVWQNEYSCQRCTSEAIHWQDDWSCGCDYDCPECGKSHAPDGSDWLPACTAWHEDGSPADDAYLLWESLPEKGAEAADMDNITGSKVPHAWVDEAETLEQLDEAIRTKNYRRETATILAALRFWQAAPDGWKPARFVDIATDGCEIEPLTADEIDRLCEQINCEPLDF